MPTGATDMVCTVPAGTFPPGPGSTAWAGRSTWVCPAASTPSWVVAKATRPAVKHTVPWGMGRSAVPAVWTENRRVPAARLAGSRVMPRRKACLSKSSPVEVWGKHCFRVHALSRYRP